MPSLTILAYGSPWARGARPRRGPDRKGRWPRLAGAILPLNRLRRTKLVALSGIWPKSLPDALLGRSRRPSGTQIPLEQRVDDLEHFAEVSFHLPEFQCGERSEKHTLNSSP